MARLKKANQPKRVPPEGEDTMENDESSDELQSEDLSFVPTNDDDNSDEHLRFFDEWYTGEYRSIFVLSARFETDDIDKMKKKCSSDFKVTHLGEEVTGEDILALLENGWLNDNVINFFFIAIFANRQSIMEGWNHTFVGFSKDVFFRTSFVPETITDDFKSINESKIQSIVNKLIDGGDIKNVDRIFIPVNFKDTHWFLIVLNVENKVLEYYDSLWSVYKNNATMKELFLSLQKVFDVLYEMSTLNHELKEQEWKPTFNAEINQQENSDDCGIFTILNAELININCESFVVQDCLALNQTRRIMAALLLYCNIHRYPSCGNVDDSDEVSDEVIDGTKKNLIDLSRDEDSDEVSDESHEEGKDKSCEDEKNDESTEQKLSEISVDDYSKLSLKDKLKLQLKLYDFNLEDVICVTEPSSAWEKKKMQRLLHAEFETKTCFKQLGHFMPYKSYLGGNLLFDIGFKVMFNSAFGSNTYCLCPCSSIYKPLMKMHNLHEDENKHSLDHHDKLERFICCDAENTLYSPEELMVHLESNADTCKSHDFTLKYLHNLYISFPCEDEHYALYHNSPKVCEKLKEELVYEKSKHSWDNPDTLCLVVNKELFHKKVKDAFPPRATKVNAKSLKDDSIDCSVSDKKQRMESNSSTAERVDMSSGHKENTDQRSSTATGHGVHASRKARHNELVEEARTKRNASRNENVGLTTSSHHKPLSHNRYGSGQMYLSYGRGNRSRPRLSSYNPNNHYGPRHHSTSHNPSYYGPPRPPGQTTKCNDMEVERGVKETRKSTGQHKQDHAPHSTGSTFPPPVIEYAASRSSSTQKVIEITAQNSSAAKDGSSKLLYKNSRGENMLVDIDESRVININDKKFYPDPNDEKGDSLPVPSPMSSSSQSSKVMKRKAVEDNDNQSVDSKASKKKKLPHEEGVGHKKGTKRSGRNYGKKRSEQLIKKLSDSKLWNTISSDSCHKITFRDSENISVIAKFFRCVMKNTENEEKTSVDMDEVKWVFMLEGKRYQNRKVCFESSQLSTITNTPVHETSVQVSSLETYNEDENNKNKESSNLYPTSAVIETSLQQCNVVMDQIRDGMIPSILLERDLEFPIKDQLTGKEFKCILHRVNTYQSNDSTNFIDKVEWEVLIPSLEKMMCLNSRQLSDFIRKFQKSKVPIMRLLYKEDSRVLSSLSDGVSVLSTGDNQQFQSQGVLINKELCAQPYEGRSHSAEEEYSMPEGCASAVDFDSCLFCGEDGKNHRYNENAICKYVDSMKSS